VQDMYLPDRITARATSDTSGRHPPGSLFESQSSVRSQELENNQNAFISSDNALPSDLVGQSMVADSDITTTITTIGTQVENYPIRQRVLVLLPANLGARLGRKVLDFELAKAPSTTAEYYDRLSILQQVLERLDFSFYDTPRGDVVIELPLYDFEPRHFADDGKMSAKFTEPDAGPFNDQPAAEPQGSVQGAFAELNRAIESLRDITGTKKAPKRKFDQNYRIFPYEQISIDLTSTDQDVKTVWVSQPRFIENFARTSQERKQVITVLPNLIPLYGVRVETGDPPGYLTTEEGCRLYNHIMLNKTNADTVSARVPCLPNWSAWVNRPIMIDSRNIISTVKSISHSIVWQSDCSTEYGLWHSKFWDGRFVTDDNGNQRMLYAPFGGVNSQPFNYAYLLKFDKIARVLGGAGGQAQAILSANISPIARSNPIVKE